MLFKVEQGRTGAGISTSTVVSILCYSLDPDSRKRFVLDIETFSRRLGKILWRMFLCHIFFVIVTIEQCELVERSKVVRVEKVTDSISLGWDLSMWRIKASGERKSLWPHEQLTCWRCWKTRLINPRQDRSSSGFEANFPDDSPLPCFVPAGWLTALIYRLLMTSKVNWDGNNVKYEPHLISEKGWVDYLTQRKQEWVVFAL